MKAIRKLSAPLYLMLLVLLLSVASCNDDDTGTFNARESQEMEIVATIKTWVGRNRSELENKIIWSSPEFIARNAAGDAVVRFSVIQENNADLNKITFTVDNGTVLTEKEKE
ncbi:hypothetical protein [Flavobacterium kingsejongi]|uniref:Uncharacterized protein n=1 Tax=Flavobacterium kingsejongi TaxID=1678728 RepID=A0A2S1LK57_9FLAO|nr:hypothetical protein [Flavobacterium kingsejongi]AWG24127.1 hypothetical protein FK004_02260 [Flavobacterium kingsejongi]